MPSIANASASFSAVPIASPTQVPKPTFEACAELAAVHHFARHRAEEGPDDQPGHAEEDAADQGAERGADHRQLAGADALGAHRAWRRRPRATDTSVSTAAPAIVQPTDPQEMVGPGGEQHAGEHQRQAGQRRQDRARQPGQDQQGGDRRSR